MMSCVILARSSLVPRPLPDFILQPWRKIDFSPWLRDNVWEWPADEATNSVQGFTHDSGQSHPIVVSMTTNLKTLSNYRDLPIVYSDGSCFRNGTRGATAGIGVYWGPDHT